MQKVNFYFIMFCVKNILKLLLILIFTFLTQVGLNSSCEISSPIESQNYIQNDYQNVVLTSEVQRSELVIASTTSSDATNFTQKDSSCAPAFGEKLNLSKTNPYENIRNIHNLSSKFRTEISIRAP